MRQKSLHCSQVQSEIDFWMLLGAGFSASFPTAETECARAVVGRVLSANELGEDDSEHRKMGGCKRIQSLLPRFSKTLQLYIHKQSVQKINHLIWRRNFIIPVFNRH